MHRGLTKIPIFIIALLLILSNLCFASEKKGVGIADLRAKDRLYALKVKWYYTWKPYPINNVKDVEFIPMIWGGIRTYEHLEEIKKIDRISYLLFLNEPDRYDQANMTVEDAINLFSEIRGLAEKISSPACAGGINNWCRKFLEEARKRNLKIDFLAIHLYTPPEPEKFLRKIDEIFEKYKVSLWITEFAVADWEAKLKNQKNKYSEEEVFIFMKKVLPELEKRKYVVRYAWFGAGKDCYKKEQIRTSCLFDATGALTKIGEYYSKFRWEAHD